MNNKLLVGALGALILLLAAPIVLRTLNPPPPPAPATTSAEVARQLAPEPVHWEPVVPQQQQQQFHQPPPQQQQQQGLNAQTLVGTQWEVSTPHGAVRIELGPNGQATATHPMVGNIPGSWRVQGNKVTASASFMGQSMSIDATIQGNTLAARGQNIRRLR